MASTPTPTQERIRLTISVTPEVHEVFRRFAEASGQSIGRTMGDWLGDTSEAAEQIASMLTRARAAPKLVIQELNSMALGMHEEGTELLRKMRAGTLGASGGARSAHPARPAAPPPRPVIRGGKSPGKGKTGGRS